MTRTIGQRQLHAVRAVALPYDQWHDWYQEYYLHGLRAHLQSSGVRVSVTPDAIRRGLLTGLREARYLTRIQKTLGSLAVPANRIIDGCAWLLGAGPRRESVSVGSYRFEFDDGRTVRLRIDSTDSGELAHDARGEDCDVYLKCNFWPDRRYASTVVPFFNCNPVVLPHLDRLRAARTVNKEYDCCFIVRVWGGRAEEEGVEHCIRMLQALSRLPGRNYVLGYLVAGDIPALEKRLRQYGIASTTRPLPAAELWSIAAKSRINILRLGMFQCIPWRMTDLLAMGSCIVLDQRPKTLWPQPLVEGTHFGALTLETGEEHPLAADEEYERAADFVESYIGRPDTVRQMAQSAAQYFDAHLDPKRLGRQVCELAARAAELKL